MSVFARGFNVLATGGVVSVFARGFNVLATGGGCIDLIVHGKY